MVTITPVRNKMELLLSRWPPKLLSLLARECFCTDSHRSLCDCSLALSRIISTTKTCCALRNGSPSMERRRREWNTCVFIFFTSVEFSEKLCVRRFSVFILLWISSSVIEKYWVFGAESMPLGTYTRLAIRTNKQSCIEYSSSKWESFGFVRIPEKFKFVHKTWIRILAPSITQTRTHLQHATEIWFLSCLLISAYWKNLSTTPRRRDWKQNTDVLCCTQTHRHLFVCVRESSQNFRSKRFRCGTIARGDMPRR